MNRSSDFQVTNYNCCDLITWQVWDRTRIELFKDLNRPFSFFETASVVDPDIVLAVGPFKPDHARGRFWIDHKYLVGPNYLYCREKLAKGWYEVEIQGFDDTQMAIKFHGRSSVSARAIAPLAQVQHGILRPVLLYQLSLRGICLLHGAAVCRDDRAIVLSGRGGTFKTSIVMDLVRQAGYKCLGDDAVLVSNAHSYPFPTHAQLLVFRMLHLKTEELVGLRDRVKALWFLARTELAASMENREIFGSSGVPLSALLVVNRGYSATTVRLREIDRDAAVNLLVANSYLETAADTVYLLGPSPTVFARFLDAYAMVYPDSRPVVFWNEFEATLYKSLNGVNCYELIMPAAYTPEISSQARKVINGI